MIDMFKDYYVKFSCPPFTDPMVVLRDIQRMLIEYKCEMTECGEKETMEKVVFRRATGACGGKAIPPKYTRDVTEDF